MYSGVAFLVHHDIFGILQDEGGSGHCRFHDGRNFGIIHLDRLLSKLAEQSGLGNRRCVNLVFVSRFALELYPGLHLVESIEDSALKCRSDLVHYNVLGSRNYRAASVHNNISELGRIEIH